MQPRLKHFGWSRENEGLTPAEEAFVLGRLEQLFGPLAEGKVKPPGMPRVSARRQFGSCRATPHG